MAVRFDCGCGVGPDGGVYCCRRHYDLVRLLHTEKWPHGVAVKGDVAKRLAWRVSARLDGVKQTAQPTRELLRALKG